VLYGIFRYTFLVQVRGAGESPEEILLRDRGILLTCLLYVVTAISILLLAAPAP